jgi:hypothetical protein
LVRSNENPFSLVLYVSLLAEYIFVCMFANSLRVEMINCI